MAEFQDPYKSPQQPDHKERIGLGSRILSAIAISCVVIVALLIFGSNIGSAWLRK